MLWNSPWGSVRFRLTVWYSLALAAALLLFAVAIWLSMWHSLQRDLDGTLSERMRSIESFLRDELNEPAVNLAKELDEYAHAFPYGTYVQVKPDAENVAAFTSKATFPWSETASWTEPKGKLRWRGRFYRVLTNDVVAGGRRWHISFAISLENIDAILSRLRFLLFTLTPLVILIAPLGGSWLSRRALKPVDEITAAARQIGIRNLSERLVVQKTGDELQRLAETWNSMLARLEDAVTRLSRFTSDASHELRTPLAVIRATAEIASRKPRSADAYRAALERIVTESERMTVLVEDLLFLARCDSDDLNMPKEPLPLSNVIEDVYSLMKPVAAAAGIRLVRGEANGAYQTFGNESAVRRLVLILVDNAIKYCKPGGSVHIGLSLRDSAVCLSVEDEGPGISVEEIPLVFQRFYRGSNARNDGNTGFGLGLALAAGIAEQHRSTIEVSSTYGQGSSFTVVFPPAVSTSEFAGLPLNRTRMADIRG